MGTSLKKVAKKAKDYKYVLLVMRHAKTEPFGDGGDAGRELTDKGRKQAKAVAKGLAAHKMVPTRIACSSATRARQTCDRMLKVFGDDRRSTIVRVCTKVGCSRYLTSLLRPRRSIASCWCSAMSPLCRSHANGWRAPNRMQCCSTC